MVTYVDNMRARVGRIVFCHMWSDTREELFAMADRIGVQRKWFQRPDSVALPGMSASWEHFDISLSKRALALAAGAIETDRYGPMEGAAWQAIQRNTHEGRVYGVKRLLLVHKARNR